MRPEVPGPGMEEYVEKAAEHHFVIVGNNFRDGVRMCGRCDRGYDDGNHIEITDLKPYTSYVCPVANGALGHSSRWTGAYRPDGRQVRDKFCICGELLVEEDNEVWRLSWEMVTSPSDDWHPVSKVASRHASHAQRDGLLQLIAQGEPIRNVTLEQVAS